MPTFDAVQRFWQDYRRLTPEQQDSFLAAVRDFVSDFGRGTFRKGLRVKRVGGVAHVFEMTWAPDGRATFHSGPEVRPGQPHVVWRWIGGHEIFRRP